MECCVFLNHMKFMELLMNMSSMMLLMIFGLLHIFRHGHIFI